MAMSSPTLRPADPVGAALGSLADHVGAALPSEAGAGELRVTGVTLSSRDVVAGEGTEVLNAEGAGETVVKQSSVATRVITGTKGVRAGAVRISGNYRLG